MPFVGAFCINKEKKVLYFHIGKTGGTTIHHSLRDHGYDDGVLSNRSVPLGEKKEYFKGVVDEWEDYFKFTSIRNKFEQLVSLYHFDKNHGHLGDMSFDEFITNKVQKDLGNYGEWLDQYELTHLDGECIYDFIGDYKNFKEYFSEIMNNVIGIEIAVPPKKNITNRDRKKHFSEYYTKETEGIVREKFKDEINHFKFSME